jgi:hypothetical protein
MPLYGPSFYPVKSASRIASAAASTNATLGVATPAFLLLATGYNAANSVRYLKLYNKARQLSGLMCRS